MLHNRQHFHPQPEPQSEQSFADLEAPKTNPLLSAIGSTSQRIKGSLSEAHQSWEEKLEQRLTQHRAATQRAWSGIRGAINSVREGFDSLAHEIAAESGAGVDTIRKSLAYKGALDHARAQLEVGETRTISASERQQVAKLLQADINEIHTHYSEKLNHLFAENANPASLRSEIRSQLPALIDDGVSALSKIAAEVKMILAEVEQQNRVAGAKGSANIQEIYHRVRGMETAPALDRLGFINAIAGSTGEHIQPEPETRQLTGVPEVLLLVASKEQPQRPEEEQQPLTQPVAQPRTLASDPEPSDIEQVRDILNTVRLEDLKRLAKFIQEQNPELAVENYKNLRKAELLAQLSTDERVALLAEHIDDLPEPVVSYAAKQHTEAKVVERISDGN